MRDNKTRPRPGLPFGVGYFETADADEVLSILEAAGEIEGESTDLKHLQARRVALKSVAVALKTSTAHAEELDESLRRVEKFLNDHGKDKELMEALSKSAEAERLKKVMSKLETCLQMYGHEILPKLKEELDKSVVPTTIQGGTPVKPPYQPGTRYGLVRRSNLSK